LDLKILAMTARDVFVGSGVIPGQTIEEVDDLGFAPPPPTTNGVSAGHHAL